MGWEAGSHVDFLHKVSSGAEGVVESGQCGRAAGCECCCTEVGEKLREAYPTTMLELPHSLL